jgi:hypothetical protein
MIGPMVLVVLGAILFAIPPLIPIHYRSRAVDNGARDRHRHHSDRLRFDVFRFRA